MTPEFWRDRRVFLTGHTGFKGSWLALWLHSLGAQVGGYSLAPPTVPSLFEVAGVSRGIASVEADVRDLERLATEVARFRPEVVFHLAAQPLVRESYRSPVDTYATNVMGTVHLLEAVRRTAGVRVVLNITSDKCYENREWIWGYREVDRLGGRDPYSNSKGCAELVTAAYRASFFPAQKYSSHGVALASARAGNVFGGGDWARDRLVPDCMRAFLAGSPVVVRSPEAVRPWQHVLEPLHGYLLLAERLHRDGPAFAEPWNFGPRADHTRSVAWVVERLAEKTGGRTTVAPPSREHHEAGRLALDSSMAESRLGWRPLLGLEEGLDLTVEWYTAFGRRDDMRQLTLRQIAEFMDRATQGESGRC